MKHLKLGHLDKREIYLASVDVPDKNTVPAPGEHLSLHSGHQDVFNTQLVSINGVDRGADAVQVPHLGKDK